MWDEITVSLANESIESLEIESPRTRKTMQIHHCTVQLYGFQGGIIDIKVTAPLPPKKRPGDSQAFTVYYCRRLVGGKTAVVA